MRYLARSVAAACAVQFLCAGIGCAAGGGKITYPNGAPVAGAAVQVMTDGKESAKFTTDASGTFALPDQQFAKATVVITAPDGSNYASIALPAKLFQGGRLSVVLQKKK